MQTITKKLRLIYLPFLVMTISFIVLYSFLNWLLFIKTNTFSIKEDIVNFWLPFGLPWIPVLLWLRPRIKLLKLTSGNGNLPFLYQFIAALAMAIPTIVAQGYIEKASGTLTKLETINEIDKGEQTKYYTVKSFYIDKTNIGVHSSFDVSGKHNENFNMHLYVVLPILGSEADTTNSNCLAWLGVEYSEQISNRLEYKEKEEKYQAFANESQKDFDNKDVNKFVYLDRVGNTGDGDGFKEAVKKSPKYNSNNTSVFLAVNEPFENRNGNTFAWIFGSFGITGGIWLIMLLIPKLDESELNRFESGKPSNDNEVKEFIDFLKPNEGYFITPIIIYLNILIFMIMVFTGLGFFSFKGQDLLAWGANFRPSTTNGEWWRLLTSTFLHGGLIHLIANMYGLLFVGIFLEPLLGRTKYLTVYLLMGILASCASLWWYDATVSVGASGAIFGLYGLFLALLLTKIFPPDFGKAFFTSTLIFIGYNLLMGLNGGIDNAAHIGGLLSGFVVGLILYPTLKKQVENEPTE
ncbi:rhomboid family intramembrane serine protease [Myroides sp. JBRI-B21084]|uniref:rhomboid family intramembrane serine protease n=1 Tax=Myroides sp. JBRI-B21084 TaxID=3119977 RepID=UPI0026E30C8E|nr:rhomboid family intramembrane serine protease [Paenimyroides cloacae]WKW45458.1 rhomboid family intramembrane serine protease [Paenimyroides cloacae]